MSAPWYVVLLRGEPAAVFQYADQARDWASRYNPNGFYAGVPWRVVETEASVFVPPTCVRCGETRTLLPAAFGPPICGVCCRRALDATHPPGAPSPCPSSPPIPTADAAVRTGPDGGPGGTST